MKKVRIAAGLLLGSTLLGAASPATAEEDWFVRVGVTAPEVEGATSDTWVTTSCGNEIRDLICDGVSGTGGGNVTVLDAPTVFVTIESGTREREPDPPAEETELPDLPDPL